MAIAHSAVKRTWGHIQRNWVGGSSVNPVLAYSMAHRPRFCVFSVLTVRLLCPGALWPSLRHHMVTHTLKRSQKTAITCPFPKLLSQPVEWMPWQVCQAVWPGEGRGFLQRNVRYWTEYARRSWEFYEASQEWAEVRRGRGAFLL